MTDPARVLVVDDTPTNLRTLYGVLKDSYQVSVTTSGKGCLDFVQNKTVPDLILLDIMMPEMDGYEVCQRLKANKDTRHIPIIFVTAMNTEEDEARGLGVGAVDYITKPISPPIVLARVKNHLLLKKQHDQLQKSISLLEHKAELGIQAGSLAHDLNNILSVCTVADMIPALLPDDLACKQTILGNIDMIMDSVRLGNQICQGYTSYLQDIGANPVTQPILPLLQPIDMYSKSFKGRLIKDIADSLPPLYCKGYQIKRVLVNLFTNACQAIESQTEQIITLKVWYEKGQIYLSIKDNGRGIPQKILPNIFEERFTTKKQGTGLGLFIVKEIVENHHGAIQVATEEGKGTAFILSFPAADKLI
jgi:CheY-like chemotaxis protein/anti-sigma regulatory factor (Ser/Thr protein kinase)